MYELIKKYFVLSCLSRADASTNKHLLEILKYLAENTQANPEFKTSYVSLIISKVNYQNFISQSSRLIDKCVHVMNSFQSKDKEQMKQFEMITAFLDCISNHKTWKCFVVQAQPLVSHVEQLLRETTKSYLLKYKSLYDVFGRVLAQNLQSHSLLLSKTCVNSVLSLAVQTLKAYQFQSSVLLLFASCVLTVPAVVNCYVGTVSLKTELDCDLSCRLYALFSDCTKDRISNEFLVHTDLVQAMSFLGNLCSLSAYYDANFQFNADNFIIISNKILDYCAKINTNHSAKTSDVVS